MHLDSISMTDLNPASIWPALRALSAGALSLWLSFPLFSADRNLEILQLSPEKKEFYQKLAEAYAPVFYADQAEIETKLKGKDGVEKSFVTIQPGDAIVSPDFDEDKDWSNNPVNIQTFEEDSAKGIKPKFVWKAEVPYLVAETKTHYYVTYMKYNAVDKGPGDHGQDSEEVFNVIRKPSSDGEKVGHPYGILEFVATNAHGIPNIYSPNEALESKLRTQVSQFLSVKKSFFSFVAKKFVDRNANAHSSGRPEFVKVGEENRGMRVLVCSEGHALYKCNSQVWKDGKGKGTVYQCSTNGIAGETSCFPMKGKESQSVDYKLTSFDQMIMELYPANESSLSENQRKALKERREKIFEGRQDERSFEVTDGVIALRSNLPAQIIRGQSDGKAEANLPTDWGLRTPHSLAVPHAVHRALMPDAVDKISDEYLFNPYIEYKEQKTNHSPALKPQSGLCAPKNNSEVSQIFAVVGMP